jgi:hypothetical protein
MTEWTRVSTPSELVETTQERIPAIEVDGVVQGNGSDAVHIRGDAPGLSHITVTAANELAVIRGSQQ